MRFTLIALVIGLAAYFGYQQFFAATSTDADGTNQEDSGEGGTDGEPPRVSADQESRLRDRIEGTSSPESDRERYQLSRILLEKKDDAATDEGVELLTSIVKASGEYSPNAATALFRVSGSGGARLERARMVERIGPKAPAYPEALHFLGRHHAERTEDSEQIKAWEYLSNAYFSTDNPIIRDKVRPDAQAIANRLLLSPRRTKAAERYTVVAGDNLDLIAKRYKTTVEMIQFVNNIKTHLIHPRDSLKILTGEVSLLVDKSDYRLDVLLDGKFLYSAPVGLGRHGKTPTSEFVIEDRQLKPAWHRSGQRAIPYGDPENPLGEAWLGFKDTDEDQGYGIHGTDKPDTIGTESSDGCVRLRNEDIMMVYRLVSSGTRVTIRE